MIITKSIVALSASDAAVQYDPCRRSGPCCHVGTRNVCVAPTIPVGQDERIRFVAKLLIAGVLLTAVRFVYNGSRRPR